MGQKVNPIGLRLKVNKDWQSTWYFDKHRYAENLHSDINIRKFIEKKLKNVGVSQIRIERYPDKVNVVIRTPKPGQVIGRDGKDINKLKNELAKKFYSNIFLNIEQENQPDVQATLVAKNLAGQIEGRLPFRRAMKQALSNTMRGGAQGVKIMLSGRLNGAEMARRETYKEGRIPLHTLKANIDYGTGTAYTTYGTIGIKVWIYKGDMLEQTVEEEEDKYAVKRRTR